MMVTFFVFLAEAFMNAKIESRKTANSDLISNQISVLKTHHPFHPTVWVLWLLAALLPAILTQNPFYLVILIVVVGFNYFGLDTKSPTARGWRAFLHLGFILVIISILFNILFVRAGVTHLFTLPALHWQTTTEMGQVTMIQIGGKVTLESLVYGLSTGLSLMVILLIFAVFNTQVDHYQLLRRTPRFLYQSAIVMSIAITFIPHMFLAQHEIRQAQTLRGHRFRRIRDLLPLLVTLLAEGLERSLTLAESMEARGFSSTMPGQQTHPGLLIKVLIALALISLAGGAFLWSYASLQMIGGILMLVGGIVLGYALWRVGRKVRRSTYRRMMWRQQDTVVAIATATSLGIVLMMWLVQRAAFIFYPYPQLTWPTFSPLIGAGLLLLLAPVLLYRFRPASHTYSMEHAYD
jgi:energy-coupling factor transport system permease protein